MEYAAFGPALHHRRRQFLNDIATAESVLVLGDGDGRFTADFLSQNKSAVVHFVECSRSMTELAAARFARLPNGTRRVRQVLEDARTVRLTGKYDVVVTHFFLDCFSTEELERLIPRITAHIRPGGRWIISEFQIAPSGFRRAVARLVVTLLYLAFGVLTGLKTTRLPDYRRVLERNGYTRIAQKPGVTGLVVSELWQRR